MQSVFESVKKIYKMLKKKNYQSKKLTSAFCTGNSDLFADRIEGTNRTDI